MLSGTFVFNYCHIHALLGQYLFKLFLSDTIHEPRNTNYGLLIISQFEFILINRGRVLHQLHSKTHSSKK